MKKISTLLIAFLILWTNVLFAQHLKKDGTPDMRYKENKASYSMPSATSSYSTASFSSENYSATHLKKDGTPDRRYKENKTSTTSNVTSTSSSYSRYSRTRTTVPTYHANTNYSSTAVRDVNGKIKRSEAAKLAFMKRTNFSHGRPGYIIDHIIPLKKGGCDCPANMQWQTIAEAKEKDKWE